MPDYKEQLIEGVEKTWQRANTITIDNTYGKAPVLSFNEETRTLTPSGKTFAESVKPPLLTIAFNPSAIVPMLNPVTDQPFTHDQLTEIAAAVAVGVFPQALIQITIYSAYKQACAARDSKPPRRN